MLDRLRAYRPTQNMLAVAAFAMAALVSALIAFAADLLIESRSAAMVRSRILAEGLTWVEVQPDGLQIHLIGTAPNEAARYRVVNLTGSIIESSRIRDKLEVAPAKTVEAPRFSVEMLRNDDGIQLIGLLPEGAERDLLASDAQALTPEIPLSDMLETAGYVAPAGWDKAFAYGVAALKLLPRSKISVAADHVDVTAIAASDNEKRLFEAELTRIKPEGIAIKVDISAPRPVLTPFTLRFVKDAEGARFDACSADSEKARTRNLEAAQAAGVDGRANCTIGLGVPTPSWAEAAEAGIRAVDALGAGTITCNYDGYFKYKTIIGERAFIGSNSALIAPVKIGADAIVAAGSAVSRDVGAGELRMVRADQLVKPGWADRFHDAMKKKKAEKKS